MIDYLFRICVSVFLVNTFSNLNRDATFFLSHIDVVEIVVVVVDRHYDRHVDFFFYSNYNKIGRVRYFFNDINFNTHFNGQIQIFFDFWINFHAVFDNFFDVDFDFDFSNSSSNFFDRVRSLNLLKRFNDK